MLDALVAGVRDSEAFADLALGHLRAKIPELREALNGKVRDHHRFLLERLLFEWRFVIGEIAALDRCLEHGRPEWPVAFSFLLLLGLQLYSVFGLKLHASQPAIESPADGRRSHG